MNDQPSQLSHLTDIPPEQRKALHEISIDSSRTFLERATHLEHALSEISTQLHTRSQTLKDSTITKRTTSKIAAQLINVMVSQKERVAVQKQTKGELQKKREEILETGKSYTDLEQSTLTAQEHITTIQTSMQRELDRLVDQRKHTLQQTREATQALREKTETELQGALNNKTYEELSQLLVTQKKQLDNFDSSIATSEKTLRDLETPESPEYLRYSPVLISELQSKIDESSARHEKVIETIGEFSKYHSFLPVGPTQPIVDNRTLKAGVEDTIDNLELTCTNTINMYEELIDKKRSSLDDLGLNRFSTRGTLSDVDRAFSTDVRTQLAADPASKSATQLALFALLGFTYTIQCELARCTTILSSKKEEHERLQKRATQRKNIAESLKARFLREYTQMEQQQERVADIRKQQREHIDMQNAEEKSFEEWTELVSNIKGEITALYPNEAE